MTLWPNSITNRVTLSALGIFVLSVWVFAFLTTRILEQDISQLVADAQVSATSQIAAQLDRELGGRLVALAQIAAFNRLLHSLHEHQQENQRFRTIADNALYGKSIADLQGNIVYINRFFAEIHNRK